MTKMQTVGSVAVLRLRGKPLADGRRRIDVERRRGRDLRDILVISPLSDGVAETFETY